MSNVFVFQIPIMRDPGWIRNVWPSNINVSAVVIKRSCDKIKSCYSTASCLGQAQSPKREFVQWMLPELSLCFINYAQAANLVTWFLISPLNPPASRHRWDFTISPVKKASEGSLVESEKSCPWLPLTAVPGCGQRCLLRATPELCTASSGSCYGSLPLCSWSKPRSHPLPVISRITHWPCSI